MANKYNSHSPVVVKEDINSEKQLLTGRHIQKHPQHYQHQQHQQQPQPQQQQYQHQQQFQQHYHQYQNNFHSEPDNYNPTPPYCSPNYQKLVLKSTLNPNAKEFYPSYMEPPKNGFKNPIANYVMRLSAPDYKYALWSNYEYENRCSAGRCMQEQVQRSNTLPLAIDYSNNCNTPFQIKTLNSGNEHKNQIIANNMLEGSPANESEILRSGENVWFIDKRIETNEKKSNELTAQEISDESCSREKYYDAQVSWSEATSTDRSTNKKYNSEDDQKQEEDGDAARKKLIMLFPTKNQQILTEGSQESIFEGPNPISYTSDESFLAQSNTYCCFSDDMDQVMKRGKEFYEDQGKTSSHVLDELEDLSEDFESTAKPSESNEIEEDEISKCAFSLKPEKPTTKQYKTTTTTTTATSISKVFPIYKKPKLEKVQKLQNSEASSEKDVRPQKQQVPISGTEPKTKKIVNNSIVSKEETIVHHKVIRSGFTTTKTIVGDHNANKATENVAKTTQPPTVTPATAAGGAIPKAKEAAVKSFRRLSSNHEHVNKTLRNNAPKCLATKKETKDVEMRQHRQPASNESACFRQQITAQTRRIDGGGSHSNNIHNNHTETKSNGKAECLEKKPQHALTTRSDQKPIVTKFCDTLPSNTSKHLSQNPSANVNVPNRKRVPFKSVKERLMVKSVIKSQMRSSTEINPPPPPPPPPPPASQTKKIIVINNAPKKEIDIKKAKATNTVSRNNAIDKTSKIIASTKIPIRQQKFNAPKETQAVVGSDGDNPKIQSSKSCGVRKIITENTSRSSTNIGDKLSVNRKELKHREALALH